MISVLAQLFGSTVRVSTPLIFAAMGGLVCERSGVVNIALEGMMIVGAFSAAAATEHFGSPWIGVGFAMASGMILAAFYAFCVITFRANQIVAGTAVNMLAMGVAPFLSKILYESTAQTPALPMNLRLGSEPVVAAFALVLLLALWLARSPSGLWVQFAGEHPEALDSAGIRVNRVRWFAVLVSGVLAGLGGASLSIALGSSFSRGMTAGRGFMALAALIFGKWKPVPAAIACLLFGFAEAIQIRLQGVVLWGSEPVPVQFVQIFPYVVTVLVLAGVVGQSRAPARLGLPFEKA